MKTDFKRYNLPKAAAKEHLRFAMNAIQLNVEKKQAVATNGKILAIVPVEIEEGDVSGLIPTESWTLAAKSKKPERVRIKANGKAVTEDSAVQTTFDRPEGEFPRYENVIPKPQDDDVLVSLDPELLFDLAKAIGGFPQYGEQVVTLRIPKGLAKAITVTPFHGGGAVGFIMPLVSSK